MATMTMLVFEKDGVEIMLTEADAVNRAMVSGDIQAETFTTVYLSDRSSAHMRAVEHPQLAGYFPTEPQPDVQPEAIADPAEPASMSERLRALEANLDEGGPTWSNPAPYVAHPAPVTQVHRLPNPKPAQMKGRKSRIVAAFLAAVLGVLGVHKFYLGKTRVGWFTLAAFMAGAIVFTPLAQLVLLIVWVEAVLYLFQSEDSFQAMVEREG